MELEYKKKNIWLEADHKEIMGFAEGYKDFLKGAKTERSVVSLLAAAAEKRGFVDLLAVESLEQGQGFYLNHRNKSFFMGILGEGLEKGIRLLASHIDAPRLDLKGQPLYEEEGLALFKTHYYGGIKKYQWVTVPLTLEGVVYRKDGTAINLSIGDKEGDPVFTITDLLPHLASDQMSKTASKVVDGEMLNVLVGSIPKAGDGEDAEAKAPSVKKGILSLLNREYGLLEEDFLRAELEIVPQFSARDVGFDRSMIGAYGQDDRICTYSVMEAFFDSLGEGSNQLAAFFDKEEIGSSGDTGARSRILEYVVSLLISKSGSKSSVLEVFYGSKGISADVSAVEDPSHMGVMDKYNRGQMGYGPIVGKYSGSRGKYDANDTSAEFLAYVMAVLDREGVLYQFGELGKVDQGGGGTIAADLSQLGMEVVDMGPGLLSMHSPFEIASKADLFMTYMAYKAFLRK